MEEFSIKEEKEQSDDKDSEDFVASSSIKDAVKDLPEVLSFIQRLQECILRQRSLLHRLYAKLKTEASQKNTTKDESTQTSEDDVLEWCTPVKPESIVEDIKEAAESAVHQSGFVYEASSGMYYDYNTGYYYNAELGLYYDGQTGIYYYFNESSKSFQFHSQVELPVAVPPATDVGDSCAIAGAVGRTDDAVTAAEVRRKSDDQDIVEQTGVVDQIVGDFSRLSLTSQYLSAIEVANAWPPCLRVIVKETGLENLSVGSLFIVTCTGGTLGREGDHAIFIPDINISKHHAKVSFSEEDSCYKVVDLGSRNGTYVDGKRISVALRESEPVELHHGTMVKVGCTRLECHVHAGRDTCPQCEPGCAQQSKPSVGSVLTEVDHETREARHRSELRRLRKRFGLDKLKVKEANPGLAEGYKDRAEERRRTVGSHDHHEKTEVASINTPIKKTNKGFKMLSKMGWAEGQSLGKDTSEGITEPVTVEQRPDKAGLGVDLAVLPPSSTDRKIKRKAEVWKKAQQRFQNLDDS